MLKQLHHDVYAGVIILVTSLFFIVQAKGFPERAALFPYLILGLFIFFAILLLINGFRKTTMRAKAIDVPAADDEEQLSFNMIKMPVLILVTVTIYVILINVLGFFVSTAIFMIGILFALGMKSLKAYFLTIVFTLLFIYLLFVKLLHVFLPTGLLF